MSTEATNYAETLNRQWGDVPKDVILPAGSYRLKLKKAKKVEPKDEGDSLRPQFAYAVVEPGEDVDKAAFAKIAKKDLDGLTLFHNPWLSSGGDYRRMTEHMVKHGVDLSKAKDRWHALELLTAAAPEVICYIEPRTYTSKRSGAVETTNDLKEFAPVRK